jgi:3-oxoacyl-(acyl-carrier-protein) synthase
MRPARVWVTGLGAVSAAGLGITPLVSLLRQERSATAPIAELGGRNAGRAPALPRHPVTRRLDRSAQMVFLAALEAWADAGLLPDAAPPRSGLIEGSSLGPLGDAVASARGAEAKLRAPRPSGVIRFMPGAGGAAFAGSVGMRGPVLHVSAGSVSALAAIGEAWLKVASGQLDLAICGGSECPLQPEVIDQLAAAGVLAAAGANACRPFDPGRDGTVLGEGAGMMVLESERHARARGARARAVLRGYGFVSEGVSMTAPDPAGRGVAEAVSEALRDVPQTSIGWIKAHGTGTRANDAAEARGLASVFGGRLPSIPITSLKPALGHTLGASGGLEAVVVALGLGGGFIPPTLGTTEVDPSLPPCTVALRARPSEGPVALVLAQGFGGRCAALALERA